MKILTLIFDTIFPPRVTEVLLREVTELKIKSRFLPHRIQHTICLSTYKEPLIRALITENKYHESEDARKHLATLLELWLHEQTIPVVLIPIPLSAKRERTRGYNQVTVVLKALSQSPTTSIDTTLLKRNRHTTAQTTLNREDRLKNLTSAFSCDTQKVYSYRHCALVIVDDVFTSGATMKAAHAAIAPHLHPTTTLLCLAFAH